MPARFAPRVIPASVALIVCLQSTSHAADFSEVEVRGKAILQEKCARCHAIEPLGESPLEKAPPMRDVYARFNPRELQAELSEGKVSKHKEMPQIAFSDEDVYAILSYLYALSLRK